MNTEQTIPKMVLKKLAFYFDLDNSGVVKGEELKKLKIWIDIDGDGVTDKGELVPLSKHGITEIVIPGHHKMDSTMKTQEWTKQTMETVAKDLKFTASEMDPYRELGFIPQSKVEEKKEGKLPLIEPPAMAEQYPEGSWQLEITEAQNIFKQKLLVRGGNRAGSYEGKAGTKFKMMSDKPWQLAIQHDDGQGGPWVYSKLQPTGKGQEFTLRSENWTDDSFNDLTVKVTGVPSDGSMIQKVAANQTARFWGDPHFVGADGGKFDVQGEPNKTFNILTDKGLQFHGLFIAGKPPGVTLVGQTSIRLDKDGKSNAIQFEPRKQFATIDGRIHHCQRNIYC